MNLHWLSQQSEVPRKDAVPLALAIAGVGLVIFLATLKQIERR